MRLHLALRSTASIPFLYTSCSNPTGAVHNCRRDLTTQTRTPFPQLSNTHQRPLLKSLFNGLRSCGTECMEGSLRRPGRRTQAEEGCLRIASDQFRKSLSDYRTAGFRCGSVVCRFVAARRSDASTTIEFLYNRRGSSRLVSATSCGQNGKRKRLVMEPVCAW